MDFYVDGALVSEGQVVSSGRGEAWIYQGIAQEPSPGKSGKVIVRDPEVPEGEPFHERVFYPHVFGKKDGVIR
jgi:hypothetical protein